MVHIGQLLQLFTIINITIYRNEESHPVLFPLTISSDYAKCFTYVRPSNDRATYPRKG